MEDIVATLARHDERIEKLEEWQQKQNESLQRLEEKADKLYSQQLTLLGGVVASLLLLCINLFLGR